MKKFQDLKFEPHTTGPGLHALMFFPNGYGVSVVRFKIPSLIGFTERYGSYTNDESEWELAVLIGNEDDWELTYDTEITDDVLGHLSERDVDKIMGDVQRLPSIVDADQRSVATGDASSNADDIIEKENYEYERGNE